MREQLPHRWNHSNHFLQSHQVSLVVAAIVRQPLEGLLDRKGQSYTAIIGPRPIIQCQGFSSNLTYRPSCRIRLHVHRSLWIFVLYVGPRRYNERTTEYYGRDISPIDILCRCFHHNPLGADIRRSRKSTRQLTFHFWCAGPSTLSINGPTSHSPQTPAL